VKPLTARDRKATYIGDGAYADSYGFMLRVFTTDGISITNEIYFEPNVYHELTELAKRVWGTTAGGAE
jgi:hypothetical protein